MRNFLAWPRRNDPYRHARMEREISVPNPPPQDFQAYAEPSEQKGSPYNDEFGWAPGLRQSPLATPDPYRLGLDKSFDGRPDPGQPPENFYDREHRDIARRESVTFTDADGWTETKHFPGYENPGDNVQGQRWAVNPRAIPPPESRPTMRMAPRTYTFLRPFDGGMGGNPKDQARRFTGDHFSMADHRRNYDAMQYGMAPQVFKRNTYRVDPQPWDTNIVDTTQDTAPSPIGARVEVPQIVGAEYGNRSWRLGG